MKIEIIKEKEGLFIYQEGTARPKMNFKSNFLNPYSFDNEDILMLLGSDIYNTCYLNGQYKFNVSRKNLEIITGERNAQAGAELTSHYSKSFFPKFEIFFKNMLQRIHV